MLSIFIAEGSRALRSKLWSGSPEFESGKGWRIIIICVDTYIVINDHGIIVTTMHWAFGPRALIH